MTQEIDKRRAILNATLDLIAEHGFHGTSMSMIVKRSQVSAGIIYHYFLNKDDLIVALYDEVKVDFTRAMLIGAPQTLPYPDRLKRVWRNAYWYAASHPQETSFIEQFENSPYIHTWKHDESNEDTRTLYALIEQDMASGHIQRMSMEVLYVLTIGVAVNLAKRQIAGSVIVDETLLEQVATACLRAVESS